MSLPRLNSGRPGRSAPKPSYGPPPIHTTVTSRSTISGASRRAVAMSVSGPRKATNNGPASSRRASSMMSCAPGESTGVPLSYKGVAAPFSTRTASLMSISESTRSISARLSCMLAKPRRKPKWAATRPRMSSDGDRSAWTMAYWSSASFLASVSMITRRRMPNFRSASDTTASLRLGRRPETWAVRPETWAVRPETRAPAYGRRRLGSGLQVLEVLENAGMGGLPSEGGAGVGGGRGLVHGEDRAERPEGVRGHGLHGEAEPSADDCGDVAYRVALVGDGVPGRSGRRRFESQPEEDGRVESMHARPPLGAVARIAGHPAAAGPVDQQAGEPTLAPVVDGARHAHRRGPDVVGGEGEQRLDRAGPAGDRPFQGERILLGRCPARHPRRSGNGDDRAVAADQGLAQRGHRRALLGDGGRQPLGGLVAGTEGEADHAVGLGRSGPQLVEVGELSPEHLGAGLLEGLRRSVRAGQGEDGVAVAEELGDHGGADGAGAAGDEDVHGILRE